MILHLYLARRFLFSFAIVSGTIIGLVVLVDFAEHVRRFDGQGLSIGQLLGLACLNSTKAVYETLPLITILTTVWLFMSLARSSELVVTRAAGRSALLALFAPLIVALSIGVTAVGALNPMVAATTKVYDQRVERLTNGTQRIFSISGENIWLRQGDAQGQTLIRAARVSFSGATLFDVTYTEFTPNGTPLRRIEARRARLLDRYWRLNDAKTWDLTAANPESVATFDTQLDLPTNLTIDEVLDSIGTPKSISFWQLPEFIARLELAGFSGLRHRVWLQRELATPALMVAMVLVGAAFTLRHTRAGRGGIMVSMALGLGFALFFIRNFALVLGENGQLPIALAAWAPPVAAILLPLGLLLHLEDG